MRKYLFTGMLITMFCSSFAQTNTFPASGNVGIGTLTPSHYFHGGNNNVLEISNPNTSLHSQSHLLLSTGATNNGTSAGSVTWLCKGAAGSQGMAYIASILEEEGTVNAAANLVFATSNGNAVYQHMFINKDGLVGIGTTDTQGYKLAVNGNIRAKEIKVENANWPDYVFAKDYQLSTLQQTEQHIKAKGHLPGIPSAADIKANGIDLGEMNAKLLQKIEELTLHLIEQNKKLDDQQKMLAKQQLEIQELKK